MANKKNNTNETSIGTPIEVSVKQHAFFSHEIARGEYITERNNCRYASIRYIVIKTRIGHETWLIIDIPYDCEEMSYHVGGIKFAENEIPHHAHASVIPDGFDNEVILCYKQNTINSAEAMQEAMKFVTSVEFYD